VEGGAIAMLNGIRNGFYTWSHGVAYWVKGAGIGRVKARLSGAESFGTQPLIFGKVKFTIIDHDRHELEPGTPMYRGPVIIRNNVWLCRNVCVMPGVTVGDGSVIGANSVVTKDIPAGVFAAGAPAKVIRQLNLPEGWVRHGPVRPVKAAAAAAAPSVTTAV
jgi:hypothetical protein